jgi:hypothetical protein
MTELTQAELANEFGYLPGTAKGWMRTWQKNYAPDSLRTRRLNQYLTMSI